MTDFIRQDNQEHRLIAKIEILEGERDTLKEEVERLRELVGVQRELVELIEHDICIYDPGWKKLAPSGNELELRTKIAEIEKEMG